MGESIVKILTVCDGDPDRPLYGGTRYGCKEKLSWKSFESAIFKGLDGIQSYCDLDDSTPKVTWCVRCDHQIKEIYGDYAWVYKHFSESWKYLKIEGHEIGWHPHFWKWSNSHNTWYQCIDNNFMKECLGEGYNSIPHEFKPNSTKMGWIFHNILTLGILNDLGILADLSAVPGTKNRAYIKGKRELLIDSCDWSNSPRHPYVPSGNNYQESKSPNEEKMKILIIPVTSFTIPYHYHYGKQMLNLIQTVLTKRFFSWKINRIAGLSPTKPPQVTKSVIENVFAKAKMEGVDQVLHSYFHPDELLVERGVNSRANFIKYFQIIDNLSKRYAVAYKHVTATELVTDLKYRLS